MRAVKRIYRNCDQLKDILGGLDHTDGGKAELQRDIKLTSEQLVTGAVLPLAQWLFGRLATKFLKARIDRVLYQAGVVG